MRSVYQFLPRRWRWRRDRTARALPLLLHMHRSARRRWVLGCGRREGQCHHQGAGLRPILGDDVPVAAHVQIAGVAFPSREEEADLRAEAGRVTLEIAKLRAGARVAGDLLIDVAGEADMNGLADE